MGFYDFVDAENTFVSVIVSFDGKGNLRPEMCRINGDAWKVISCRVKSEERFSTLFWVKLKFEEQIVDCQLLYYVNDKVWKLICSPE